MKTHLKFLFIALVFAFVISCKGKKNEPKEKFFPVLSYLKSQVADIDTSLYSIRKVIYVDSVRTGRHFFIFIVKISGKKPGNFYRCRIYLRQGFRDGMSKTNHLTKH